MPSMISPRVLHIYQYIDWRERERERERERRRGAFLYAYV